MIIGRIFSRVRFKYFNVFYYFNLIFLHVVTKYIININVQKRRNLETNALLPDKGQIIIKVVQKDCYFVPIFYKRNQGK